MGYFEWLKLGFWKWSYKIYQKYTKNTPSDKKGLTIELREHIEKTWIACPTMSPDSLVKEMQKSFPTYSQRLLGARNKIDSLLQI